MMQLECDKLQDQLDQSEEEKKAFQKNLEDIVTQLKQAQAEVRYNLIYQFTWIYFVYAPFYCRKMMLRVN